MLDRGGSKGDNTRHPRKKILQYIDSGKMELPKTHIREHRGIEQQDDVCGRTGMGLN